MAEGHNYGGEVGPWLRVIRWRRGGAMAEGHQVEA